MSKRLSRTSALNTMGLRLSQASLLLIALAVGFAPLLQSLDSGDLWIGPADSVQLLQPLSSRLRPMGSEVRMAPEIAPLLSALRASTRFNWSVPRGFVRSREIDRFSIRSFCKEARAFGGGHAYLSPRATPSHSTRKRFLCSEISLLSFSGLALSAEPALLRLGRHGEPAAQTSNGLVCLAERRRSMDSHAQVRDEPGSSDRSMWRHFI